MQSVMQCTEPFDTHDPTEWQLNNEASTPETVPYDDVQSGQPALHQAEEGQKDRLPTRACIVTKRITSKLLGLQAGK